MAIKADSTVFPVRGSDASALEAFVRTALRRRDIDAHTMQGLARVYLALRRLPLATEGIVLVMTAWYRFGEEMTYFDLTINEQELVLGEGRSLYDPGCGSDHHTEQIFSSYALPVEEVDHFVRWGDAARDWVDKAQELLRLGGTVSVEDLNDTDGIDWDENASVEYRKQKQ